MTALCIGVTCPIGLEQVPNASAASQLYDLYSEKGYFRRALKLLDGFQRLTGRPLECQLEIPRGLVLFNLAFGRDVDPEASEAGATDGIAALAEGFAASEAARAANLPAAIAQFTPQQQAYFLEAQKCFAALRHPVVGGLLVHVA